uniref:Lateral signaling target protein 2 homolog n=1 Tax=Glossina morsitans morsitans TaxID=37546 RepID=A0A1B0GAE2_GLOMM
MEPSDGSPPPSLCMIRAAELFPKAQMEKEDTQLVVPFQELAGESVKYLGRTDDGVLALSNYRIFLQKNSAKVETSIPLGLIESLQARDLFHLIICCKDASTIKCSFETAEQCTEWQRRIQMSVGVPETLESIFAFPFCSWTCDSLNGGGINSNQFVSGAGIGGGVINGENGQLSLYQMADWTERLQRTPSRYEDDFVREVERLGFDLNGPWRISHANEDFKLCPSYPPKLLVPCCIPDETLHSVANFRGSRRLPAVVWRHHKSGAVIARCSQPEVGWLGWRCNKDEQLLKALAEACAFDRAEQLRCLAQATNNSSTTANITPQPTQTQIPSGESSPSSLESSHEEVALDEVKKILIVDARSYTSAVTNRARGGGCECIEYYPSAEIEFMNLGNIHVIRKSFHALRQLCASPPDVPKYVQTPFSDLLNSSVIIFKNFSWLGLLEKTMWFQHLSGLLAASMTVCHAIENKGRPVLVHCSDGWDRTPQIVATAQLCLDPFYRTVDVEFLNYKLSISILTLRFLSQGFRILVEREWLSYGHKFADRCGHGPGSDEVNERCPVFLQWLDLIHQIHKQFPCSFEFSMGFLIKLAQHSHSGLFGTFLCNTLKERIENSVFERTFSVWPFLSGPLYRNPLYISNKNKVLWPAYNVRDLSLWTEVYLGSLGGNQNSIDFPSYVNDSSLQGSISSMSKTRSYGDLISAGIIQNGISRRSSDPNMTVDPNLTIGSNSENNSIADLQSDERDNESPDILANLMHTTRQLENLTIELNLNDDDFRLQNNSNSVAFKSGYETMESTNELEANHLNCEANEQNNGCEEIKINQLHSVTPAAFEMDEIQIKNSQYGFNVNTAVLNSTILNHSRNIDANMKKTEDLSLDLLKSVNLEESTCNDLKANFNGSKVASLTDELQTMWHGSVNTSTDTLVPLAECKMQTSSFSLESHDQIDGLSPVNTSKNTQEPTQTEDKRNANLSLSVTSTNSNILPKVHTASLSKPHRLAAATDTNKTSASCTTCSISTSTALTLNSSIESHNHHNDDNKIPDRIISDLPATLCNEMEESILILPEHEKLEISVSGKCETVVSTNSNSSANMTVSSVLTAPTSSALSMPYVTSLVGTTTAQRRRRTSSSNSKRDGIIPKHINNSYISRFSLPGGGVRSLPMTPPGLTDRPSIAISCPDGLAHALSEENIRLQQIVHEHKISIIRLFQLREDVLLREIHDMRMALLKKICPNCNNAAATTNVTATNDEQCSALDNVENASISSWEAVEDRSGPSSCTTSSSIQPNAVSVLWVPDHAVSRCTSCQTEFWLGRRKHHCRSCGQIFCADCSEFWAPLPGENLLSPVRLCGPCYHSVTTRMQQKSEQPQQQNRQLMTPLGGSVQRQHITTTTVTTTAVVAATITTSSTISSLTAVTLVQTLNQPGIISHTHNSLGLQQHQQQNQCAAASMKVSNATSTSAAATTATN